MYTFGYLVGRQVISALARRRPGREPAAPGGPALVTRLEICALAAHGHPDGADGSHEAKLGAIRAP